MAAPSSTWPGEQSSLLDWTRRVDYLAGVSEVVREMLSSRDQVRAVELLREATLRMGVEASIFVSFFRDRERCTSHRLLLACDVTSLAATARSQLGALDAWIRYARRRSEPVRDCDMDRADEVTRGALELAQQFGFLSTVVVPVPSGGGLSRTAVLCLGSSRCGYFDDDGYFALKVVARGVAMELHEWWIQRLGEELVESAGLTEADLALLRHEAQGHSTKTIARQLGMSPAAIDSRFQRLNHKLGVMSRSAGAQLAMQYGLL
jgi:DNA-binding CsgD family transcriptional regulator